MKKYSIAIIFVILASIVFMVFFSIISTGDQSIELEANKPLTPDERIIENIKTMQGVQAFLSKYPDAQLSINENNNVVTYKIYLNEKKSENPPYELLVILIDEEKRPTNISVECWNGKEKQTVMGDYNVQSSIQKDFCKISQ